ncbi:MAG: class I SAM-dependent methyltransferase [Endozoicomonadaceae bacterium]|nr:class I SAM-dependent methyltransferase [Endozoicomonadaceae bacterium]
MKQIYNKIKRKITRRSFLFLHLLGSKLMSIFDKSYLASDVPMSKKVSHKNYMDYLTEIGNQSGLKILEIGSREVTGKSYARSRFYKAQDIGFDYFSGPNVNVVGDAHKLTQYFDEKFDIIYSSAVFEHFAMPWVVASEISKLLNIGGIIFVETHFSFSSHERPWNFFQFSDMGLRALFPPALGFECIEAGMSNPMIGRFSSLADDYLKFQPIKGLYCHSEFLGRKIKQVENIDWKEITLEEMVGDTQYPSPKKDNET